MQGKDKKPRAQRPLGRGITIGLFVFIISLCAALAAVNHFNYRRVLYQGHESYMTDILRYVNRHIDPSDLKACVETLERSEKFDELEKFMDGVKEDFNVHYLYILKPVVHNGSKRIMSVISAENYYDRYVNTEGNLYLGWISDDEYSEDDVDELFETMKQIQIVFCEEVTEWGVDYTGMLPLLDDRGNAYALLCVDVDITALSKMIAAHTLQTIALVVFAGLLFTLVFLLWIRRNVTRPIEALEERVAAFAQKSHGQRDISALEFEPPEIRAKNEVASLAAAVRQMAVDMRDYVQGIIQAERDAEKMRELANKDALTGIRNKTAYDKEIQGLKSDYGIAMVDLNFLKKINDTYGHERGNFAIKKLCRLVCVTFEHSPVFRIGGDEFVVILKGSDLRNIDSLCAAFEEKLLESQNDAALEPWEKVSAAVGVAFYDSAIDANVESVFKRADQKMYERKKQMKAERDS